MTKTNDSRVLKIGEREYINVAAHIDRDTRKEFKNLCKSQGFFTGHVVGQLIREYIEAHRQVAVNE